LLMRAVVTASAQTGQPRRNFSGKLTGSSAFYRRVAAGAHIAYKDQAMTPTNGRRDSNIGIVHPQQVGSRGRRSCPENQNTDRSGLLRRAIHCLMSRISSIRNLRMIEASGVLAHAQIQTKARQRAPRRHSLRQYRSLARARELSRVPAPRARHSLRIPWPQHR